MSSYLGIDVGGTTTEAVAVDEAGAVVAREGISTRTPGGDAALESIITGIERLGWDEEVDGIGLGIPGQVDPVAGTVATAVNLGIEAPYPLAARLSEARGVPVVVENDVRAAAYGVYRALCEEGTDPGDIALLSLGTGVAAGLVIDGDIYRGATGMAGEIGHVIVDPSGAPCACGQRGCLETLISGPAIVASWGESGHHSPASALFLAAQSGDSEASGLASRVADNLAVAVQWLTAAYDVDTIVLGGGVAGAGRPLLDHLRYARERMAGSSDLATRALDPDRVRLSPLGGPHGARGAALLAARSFDLALTSESNPRGGNG